MPKGGKSSLTPVSAGIQEDLNALLRGFIEIRSCRFTDFKELFKRMEMATIFNGRSYYAEIIEFNESLLCACSKYLEPFAGPDVARCKQERIFGLYALYTFFYLQQSDHVVKIRMDPDLYKIFQDFLEVLRYDGLLDAWACGLKLQQDNAIKIVAFVEIFDPTFYKNFENDDHSTKTPIGANVDVPTANLRNMLETDEFQILDLCQQTYEELKIKCNVEIKLVSSNLTKSLEQIVDRIESEYYEKCRKKEIKLKPASQNLKTQGAQRLAIKNAAYSADLEYSRTRRHRVCKEEEKEEEEMKPAKMPKIEEKKRRVRFLEVVSVQYLSGRKKNFTENLKNGIDEEAKKEEINDFSDGEETEEEDFEDSEKELKNRIVKKTEKNDDSEKELKNQICSKNAVKIEEDDDSEKYLKNQIRPEKAYKDCLDEWLVD